MRRLLVALMIFATLAGCGTSAGPSASPPASVVPSSPGSFGRPSATPEDTYLPSWVASGFPHEDPNLEAMLPRSVAGQRLTIWSVRGRDYFSTGGPLDEAGVQEIEAGLQEMGLTIDDVSQATAGRSESSDAPYFVLAVRFKGLLMYRLPAWVGVADEASASEGWQGAAIAGKNVQIGTEAMILPTEHGRGAPYVYNHGDVRFVVVSDRRDWVEDALKQLP